MAQKLAVPDVVFNLALWFGALGFVIAFGMGFVVRAEDLSPWPWWIGSFAFGLPCAILLKLESSGRVEFVDTEKLEGRILKRLPPVPARIFFVLSVVAAAAGTIMEFLESW